MLFFYVAAKNIDINRCLVPTADWKGMKGILQALHKRFGKFAAFKNRMNLSQAEAAKIHHLRLIMVTVQYNTGMTFGELCKSKHAKRKFEEYRNHPPDSTVPGERWCRQVDIALSWIRSRHFRREKVSMLCEVQCVLKKILDVRFKMHEAYKIHRATDPKALYNDFKDIRVNMKRKMRWDKDGATPGLQACRDNDVDSLCMLMEADDSQLDNLHHFLLVAVRYGSADVLQELLRVKGANECVVANAALFLFETIEAPDNYKTKARTVGLILEAKADINEVGGGGSTGLYRAAKEGHLDVVQVLIEGKATVDAALTSGENAVFMAAQNNHPEVVSALVDAHADVNKENVEGVASLCMAAQEGNLDVVRTLTRAKADINASHTDDGVTGLWMAAQEGHLDVVRVLAEAKADVDAKNNKGATALLMAADDGDVVRVRTLLSVKASVDVPHSDGATPLFKAASSNYREVVRALIKANADLDVTDDNGVTGVYMASQNGHVDMVELLVEAKADVNAAHTTDGQTSLHWAAFKGNLMMIRALIKAKANINAKHQKYGAPLQVAKTPESKKLLRALNVE